jgi:hypothetical protein
MVASSAKHPQACLTAPSSTSCSRPARTDLDDHELDALNDVLGASLKQVKARDGIDADSLHRRLRMS